MSAEHRRADCEPSWHHLSLGTAVSSERMRDGWQGLSREHTSVHVSLWSQSFINSAREICIRHPPCSVCYLLPQLPLAIRKEWDVTVCTHINTLTWRGWQQTVCCTHRALVSLTHSFLFYLSVAIILFTPAFTFAKSPHVLENLENSWPIFQSWKNKKKREEAKCPGTSCTVLENYFTIFWIL